VLVRIHHLNLLVRNIDSASPLHMLYAMTAILQCVEREQSKETYGDPLYARRLNALAFTVAKVARLPRYNTAKPIVQQIRRCGAVLSIPVFASLVRYNSGTLEGMQGMRMEGDIARILDDAQLYICHYQGCSTLSDRSEFAVRTYKCGGEGCKTAPRPVV
jgi:hypothetical protein